MQIGTNISRASIYFVLKRRTMTNRMYILFKNWGKRNKKKKKKTTRSVNYC